MGHSLLLWKADPAMHALDPQSIANELQHDRSPQGITRFDITGFLDQCALQLEEDAEGLEERLIPEPIDFGGYPANWLSLSLAYSDDLALSVVSRLAHDAALTLFSTDTMTTVPPLEPPRPPAENKPDSFAWLVKHWLEPVCIKHRFTKRQKYRYEHHTKDRILRASFTACIGWLQPWVSVGFRSLNRIDQQRRDFIRDATPCAPDFCHLHRFAADYLPDSDTDSTSYFFMHDEDQLPSLGRTIAEQLDRAIALADQRFQTVADLAAYWEEDQDQHWDHLALAYTAAGDLGQALRLLSGQTSRLDAQRQKRDTPRVRSHLIDIKWLRRFLETLG